MKSPLFTSAIFAVIFVSAVDLFALKFHLFYAIIWFDMPMHFLGGFLVSILALSILVHNQGHVSYGKLLFWGIISALVIGIMWELFELYFGITYLYSPDYIGDNGMDVTMDLFGGFSAVVYSYFKLRTFK